MKTCALNGQRSIGSIGRVEGATRQTSVRIDLIVQERMNPMNVSYDIAIIK